MVLFAITIAVATSVAAQEDDRAPWRPFRSPGESFAPAPMDEEEIAEQAAANRRRADRERARLAERRPPAGSLGLTDPRALRGEPTFGDEPVFDESPVWDPAPPGSRVVSPFGGAVDSDGLDAPLGDVAGATAAQRARKAGSLLGPFMRGPQGVAYRFLPEVGVKGTAARFQAQQIDLNAGAPIYSDDRQAVILTTQVETWLFDADARLPSSNVDFPSELWNVDVGLIHTYRFANGWDSIVRLAGGTATDRPFRHGRDATIMFLGTLRVPTYDDNNAWRFTILSMTNGPLGKYVPIPGVAYEFKPSGNFRGVIGVPAWFDWNPVPGTTVSMAYLPIVDFLAQIRHELNPWHTVWYGFESHSQSWLRADREDSKDQLFYFEQRLAAGWQIHLTESLGVQATGGYSFGRRYGEGHTFEDLRRNKVYLQPGAYFGFQGGVLF